MTLIPCRTLFNETKYVPAERLIQRPSVYGIVIHEGKLLVGKARSTQKYVLPGGGIEKGEAVEAALRREVWEETGVEVEVGAFLHFETDLFYYDPLDLALHGFLFYYACTAITTALNPPEYPPEEDLDFPLWAALDDLSAEAFQVHGVMTMELMERCRGN
ncbi:MAG: NUDIX domain-containing protein [Chloroflexi bacterium]|nr:NUDIX domain-containing protein [Chloroflexota bacterium]